MFETVHGFVYRFEHKFDVPRMVAVVATGGSMSIEAAKVGVVARSRRRRRAGGPAGRPAQPAPRVRSSRVPAARGPLGGASCVVVRHGFRFVRRLRRFVRRLKTVAFAALVVLSFIVAVPGIASLNQPDPTPTPTAGDPAWAHVTGR